MPIIDLRPIKKEDVEGMLMECWKNYTNGQHTSNSRLNSHVYSLEARIDEGEGGRVLLFEISGVRIPEQRLEQAGRQFGYERKGKEYIRNDDGGIGADRMYGEGKKSVCIEYKLGEDIKDKGIKAVVNEIIGMYDVLLPRIGQRYESRWRKAGRISTWAAAGVLLVAVLCYLYNPKPVRFG